MGKISQAVASQDAKLKSTKTIKAALNELIIGQEHAIDFIAPYIRRHQVGLSSDERPAGIFLLLGPTGVGKTHTVASVSNVVHDVPNRFLTLNCAEYQLEHEVSKLLGAPPGYIGHKETASRLDNVKIKNNTSGYSSISLILLDEIEKAHHALQQLFLGVFDKATLQLNNGELVNFRNTMIFMTSNLGAVEASKALKGWGLASAISKPKTTSSCLAAAKKHFSPEFMNRIDEVITYSALGREQLQTILDQQLQKLQVLLNKTNTGITLVVSQPAKDWFLENGTSTVWGARELQRLITRNILNPLADLIGSPIHKLNVTVKAGEIELRPVKAKAA